MLIDLLFVLQAEICVPFMITLAPNIRLLDNGDEGIDTHMHHQRGNVYTAEKKVNQQSYANTCQREINSHYSIIHKDLITSSTVNL